VTSTTFSFYLVMHFYWFDFDGLQCVSYLHTALGTMLSRIGSKINSFFAVRAFVKLVLIEH
jgi:hypothetical protein